MERERAVDARVRAAGGSSEVDGDGSGNCGAGGGSDSGAGGNVVDSGDGNGGDSAGSAGGDVLDGDSGEDHGEEETVKTSTDPRPVPVATKAKKDLGLQTFIIYYIIYFLSIYYYLPNIKKKLNYYFRKDYYNFDVEFLI